MTERLRGWLRGMPPARWAALLFALNLAWGLLFTFALAPWVADVTSGADPDGYGRAGQVWYETGRFDNIEKAPLYPLFVASISALLGGYRVGAIQVAQAGLLALACVLWYTLFRRLMAEERAKLAGLACALYPMLVWYVPRLWTEIWLALMLALFTLALARLLAAPSAGRALLCGLLAGTAALSKGIAIVMAPLAIAAVALHFGRRSVPWVALVSVGALVLLIPWAGRNWALTGELVPIHANGGYNFYLGNGFARHIAQAPLSYVDLKARTEADIAALYARQGEPPTDPLAIDERLMAAALAEFRAQPWRLPHKLAVQSLTLWYLAADAPKSLLSGALQLPIALLALPGIVRAVRGRRRTRVMLVPVLGIAGVSILVFAFARLAVTILPYLIAFAIDGLASDEASGEGRS